MSANASVKRKLYWRAQYICFGKFLIDKIEKITKMSFLTYAGVKIWNRKIKCRQVSAITKS